ncbi:MAG: 50S ribosomal protein L18 [Candidatus Cloacimonas sp. 4484_275]|nr:MAG: 50S ribosomal protein L18 [Candidatus Cloacimonas sp. 4484_275]
MRNTITYKKRLARERRKKSIRKKVFGYSDKPRLVVFRSLKNISAQIIDDEKGITLVSMSTLSKDFQAGEKAKKKTEMSFAVGYQLGKKAIEKGIKKVCFDRNGYLYHGRVKALADGVRKAGEEAGIKMF